LEPESINPYKRVNLEHIDQRDTKKYKVDDIEMKVDEQRQAIFSDSSPSFSQTGNNDSTQQLKNRISNENCGSAAVNFDEQCYAMEVETSSSIYILPDEILKNIFQQLLPKKIDHSNEQKINSGLGGCTWTSKNWHQISNEVKKEWVQFESISIRQVSNCKTANEAVEFIIKNKLTTANLSEFDLTDDDLLKLVENCPNLTFLFINSINITEYTLAEALKRLTQLQHLRLGRCTEIAGDKLAEAFKTLTQLRYLNLSCIEITGDKFSEALKTLTQLQYLNLGACTEIPGDKLAEALKTLTQLEGLDLMDCTQIAEDTLAEILKTLTQLQHLSLNGCTQITECKLAEALKMLIQLQHLDLSRCTQIRWDTLAEALKTLIQLQTLNLIQCDQITEDKRDEILKDFPYCIV
jgi:hypothetical protein